MNNNRESLPNFFIAGAPKCGTTALSEYLRTHPNIFMSTPKEPHFFAKDISPYSCCNTKKEYQELFNNVQEQQVAIGEASVLYLYSESACKNIKQFNPDAKIIIMLRNPVDYIYSYHSQLLVNSDETIEDFETAWRLQEERRNGKKIPSTCRVSKLLQYEQVGKLGEQVEKLLKCFPKNQVHFILLDDLKKNARKVYKDVLEFLELPDDNRNDFPIINENKKQVNKFLGKLRNHPHKNLMGMSRLIKKVFGLEHFHFMKIIHQVNRAKARRKPLDIKMKQELLEVFLLDINKLELLISRDLSSWKRCDC